MKILRVLRRSRQFERRRTVLVFGRRCFEYRARGDVQRGVAGRGPEKVQHAGGEEDEDPRVDDGVDGDEAQGDQVQAVRLLAIPYGVEVHPDLRGGQGERESVVN